MSSSWEPHNDGSGNTYWYHTLTGESSWDKPGATEHVDPPSDTTLTIGQTWYEVEDEASGVYYYNTATGDTVWDKPADYDGSPGDEPPKELKEFMQKAFSGLLKKRDPTLQIKMEAARRELTEAQTARDKAVVDGHGHWVEVYDPASHEFYYHDKVTGTTVWQKPEHYVMAADDETMHGVILIQTMWRAREGRADMAARKERVTAGAKADPIWFICDDHDDHRYFYNSVTHECVWEKPADFDGTDIPDPRQQRASEAYLQKLLKKALKKRDPDLQRKLEAVRKEQKGKEQERDAKVAAGEEHWVEVYCPQHHEYYYHGSYSGEVSWEKPAHYVMAAEDDLMCAVIKMQSSWRARTARREVAAKEQLRQKWVEVLDEESGHFYYCEQATGECVWDKPDGFIGGAHPNAQALANIKKTFEGKRKLLDKGVQEKLDAVKKEQAMREEHYYGKVAEGETEHWVESYDPESHQFYYYDTVTHKTVWEKPEHYVMAADDELMRAVIMMQCAWRARAARVAVHIQHAKHDRWMEGVAAADDVAEAADAGRSYFFCTESEAVTWDKPPDFVAGARTDAGILARMHVAFRSQLGQLAEAAPSPAADAAKAAPESEPEAQAVAEEPAPVPAEETRADAGEAVGDRPDVLAAAPCADVSSEPAPNDAAIAAGAAVAQPEPVVVQEVQDEGPRWARCYDPRHEAWYFYELDSKQVEWDEPDGFVSAVQDPMINAATMLQAVYRGRQGRARAAAVFAAGGLRNFEGKDNTLGMVLNDVSHAVPFDSGPLLDEELRPSMPKHGACEVLPDNAFVLEEKRILDAKMEALKMDEEAARAQMELEALRKKKRAKMRKKRMDERAKREAAREAEEAEAAALQRAMAIAQFKRMQEIRAKNLEERRSAVTARRNEKLAHAREMAEKVTAAAAAVVVERKAEQQAMIAQRERFLAERAERKAAEAVEWKEECARYHAFFTTGAAAAVRMSARMAARQDERTAARKAIEAKQLAAVEEFKRREAECATPWDVVSLPGGVTGAGTRFEELLAKAAQADGGMGMAVGARDAHGDTLLHKAAATGGLRAVRALLSNGADPCATSSAQLRVTPLHEAAANGHADICTELLKAGAAATATNFTGCTALHLAALSGHRGVALALLTHAGSGGDAGLNLAKLRNWRGQTAADMCKPNCSGGVRHLLQVDYAAKLMAMSRLAPATEKKKKLSVLPSIF